MKKLLLFSLIILAVACKDDDQDTSAGEAPNITNIENVEGNIPDTSNSATLNTPLPVDSTVKDTVPR